MRAELLSDLLAIARGQPSQKRPATAVTPVTAPSSYTPNDLDLQGLHRLQAENSKSGKDVFAAEIEPETDLAESIQDAIEERKALCAGAVPAIYLDVWTRLNSQQPFRVSEIEWRRALDDGGRFFDEWGWVSKTDWTWTAGELFDVPNDDRPGGLIWLLRGRCVVAYGPDHARLDDNSIVMREQIGGRIIGIDIGAGPVAGLVRAKP